MNMGDPVKCLVEVDQDSKDSMWLLKSNQLIITHNSVYGTEVVVPHS